MIPPPSFAEFKQLDTDDKLDQLFLQLQNVPGDVRCNTKRLNRHAIRLGVLYVIYTVGGIGLALRVTGVIP